VREIAELQALLGERVASQGDILQAAAAAAGRALVDLRGGNAQLRQAEAMSQMRLFAVLFIFDMGLSVLFQHWYND
jgi:hypothetical protein